MIELLKPLWQPLVALLRHIPSEEQFQRKHAEAYPDSSEYRDENEAMDGPTWAPLFTRK